MARRAAGAQPQADRTRPQSRSKQLERTCRGTGLPLRLRARRGGRGQDRARRRARRGADRRRLLGAFGRDRFRVELQRPFWRHDRARNRALAGLAERLGVACVATGNVHSHHPDRARLQDAFVAVRLRSTLDQTEPERRGNASSVMASPREMAERFRDHPERRRRDGALAERLEFDLTRDLGYRYPGSEDPTPTASSRELCRARLDERYRGTRRAARRRRRAWRRSCT